MRHTTNVRPFANPKAIHFSKRVVPELIVNNSYFVCFGKKPLQVKLLAIREHDVLVEDLSGQQYCLYKDELGTTPEQAVLHTVTS